MKRDAGSPSAVQWPVRIEPEPLPDWVGMLEGPGDPYADRDEEILDDSWAEAIDISRSDTANFAPRICAQANRPVRATCFNRSWLFPPASRRLCASMLQLSASTISPDALLV